MQNLNTLMCINKGLEEWAPKLIVATSGKSSRGIKEVKRGNKPQYPCRVQNGLLRTNCVMWLD